MRRVLVLFFFAATVNTADSEIVVAGIQFKTDESVYESLESFSQAVEREIQRTLGSYTGESRPDIVVFPEYTSVFVALTPYYGEIKRSASISEALDAIRRRNPSITGIRRFFLEQAGRVGRELDGVWGALARKYDIFLLGGTYFAERSGELVNLLVVYDRNGKRLYEQQKAYPTEFELDIVGLEPGSLGEAELWEVDGAYVAATICRDTFFDSWNTKFKEADYWIDIKASGTEFTAEEASRFMRALPERIGDTGVEGGMTVCLTGSYLELFWEGRSFTVSYLDGAATVEASAPNHTDGALLLDVCEGAGIIER
jgi:hypothetical protein